MDAIIQLDRRLILLLARRLRQWQERTPYPLHTVLFWSTAAAHLLCWFALCWLQDQPEWIWYVLGAAAGAVACYAVDNEPVAQLDEGIALTHFGLDARWSLSRLMYLGLAVAFFVPLIISGDFSWLVRVLFLIEVGALVLMEYLLAFRLADATPIGRVEEALAELQKAAEALGFPGQSADGDHADG